MLLMSKRTIHVFSHISMRASVLRRAPRPEQVITAVKWGGEGLIYSASRDTTINCWDAADGKLVRCLKVRSRGTACNRCTAPHQAHGCGRG